MIKKRLFDFIFALLSLLIIGGVLLFCIIIAAFETRSSGLFIQNRIGKYGKIFRIYKIKSMDAFSGKVTPFGRFLRTSKLDELPQLLNILFGQMSFVGPRPDIPGYADMLTKEDREILNLSPGLTGLASLKYRNEETLLAQQSDPLNHNDTIIWPDKVRINNWYVEHHHLGMDIKILFYTMCPFLVFDVDEYIAKYPVPK